MEKNRVYESVISVAKEIAKKKEGAIFVLGSERKLIKKYSPLYPQIHKRYYIHKKGSDKILEKLATLDGATLVSNKGKLIAYGSRLKGSIAVQGHGTKHAAAAGVTSKIKDSTAIVVSEEDNLIRIFKNGKVILEMDSKATPQSLQEKITSFILDGDTALLTAAGVTTAILGGGIIAPLAVVGGTYMAIRTASGVIKRNLLEEKERIRKV